jgi:hypothetical protein
MATIVSPMIVPYRDLFFRLSGEDLPSFKTLTNLEIPDGGEGQDLSPEAGGSVEKEMAAIHAVCRHFNYSPLISELSLISDRRVFGQREAGQFASFMAFFVPPGRSVATAYRAALEFMGDQKSGGEQIVPHPELFAPETGFVTHRFASANSRSEPFKTRKIESRPFVAATRQPFAVLEGPKDSLESRVGVFLEALRQHVESDESLTDVSAALGRSVFLLLPFVRPEFLSSAMGSSSQSRRQTLRGYPGGALFLFLDPLDRAAQIEEVARALSWLLAEASLRESYATYAVERSWKQAFATYSIAHPLKHRLTALATDTSQLLQSYNHNQSEFLERLKMHKRLVDGVRGFATLCHLLYSVLVDGPEETIAAQDAMSKLKFSTTGTLDVKSLIEGAAVTSVLTVNRKMLLRCEPTFSPVIEGFAEVGGTPVRLNDELYREVLFEVLANAYRHGLAVEDEVVVHAAIEDVKGQQAIVLSNVVADEVIPKLGEPVSEWTALATGGPSGLTFVSHALEETRAGRAYYRSPIVRGDRCYSVALALKGLSNRPVLSDGGK